MAEKTVTVTFHVDFPFSLQKLRKSMLLTSSEESHENDAAGPDVDGHGMVRAALDDLRGDVGHRATTRIECALPALVPEHRRQSKVRNLQLVCSENKRKQ